MISKIVTCIFVGADEVNASKSTPTVTTTIRFLGVPIFKKTITYPKGYYDERTFFFVSEKQMKRQ